ncbi:helix-turn-helix domain-containing protein (plasmid) [Streptomyces sp. NBC_00984]|uniref:helix-turn-helix domain-containing protein n=1 Tax=Streptomyces sp. NBC_00984 TaxID=2903700 RepID=UPI002F907DAA|nr:helix-turn-helix domain-containing protein [Streptomyces sp. NBC_00984]
MGRRENAVAADIRQSEALALWLRAQRERRGVTYAAMAKLTGHQFTASALSRGANGKVPSRRLVLAYAIACDADTREAMRLWKAARRAEEERRRRAGISPEFRDLAVSLRSVMTHPDLIDSFAKLHDVMVEMRAREGQPSLSDLQTAAGRTSDDQRHRLPKSSLSVILRGEAVPSRAHLTAFMEALNVSPNNVRRWQQVWDRLADSTARKPSVALTIKVVDVPPAEEPHAHHTPPDVGTADLDFLRGQVLLETVFLTGPGVLQGPQSACPPAGVTRSGLPIRTPRRYALTPRSHLPPGSRTTEPITLLPREIPPSRPATIRDSLPAVPEHHPVKTTVPPVSRGRIGRTVERWLRRKPRQDYTHWPNY